MWRQPSQRTGSHQRLSKAGPTFQIGVHEETISVRLAVNRVRIPPYHYYYPTMKMEKTKNGSRDQRPAESFSSNLFSLLQVQVFKVVQTTRWPHVPSFLLVFVPASLLVKSEKTQKILGILPQYLNMTVVIDDDDDNSQTNSPKSARRHKPEKKKKNINKNNAKWPYAHTGIIPPEVAFSILFCGGQGTKYRNIWYSNTDRFERIGGKNVKTKSSLPRKILGARNRTSTFSILGFYGHVIPVDQSARQHAMPHLASRVQKAGPLSVADRHLVVVVVFHR